MHLTPATTRSRGRGRLVPPLRGRRARRRDGQAARRRLRAEQARHAQGEARARLRLRRRRLSLAQGRRRDRASARCCSASTTTRGRSTTSACARASRRRSGASSSTCSRPIARTRSATHPWREWAGTRTTSAGQRSAGPREPMEPGEGPVVGAAAPRARVRGRVRSHAGHALPPHRAVPALAPRQDARATARYAQLEVVAAARARAIFASGALSASLVGRLLAPPCDLRAATRASDRSPDRAVSSGGRSSSGTWRRLTRMRVQVDERPRIESTSTSSTARSSRRSGCSAFQRSRPASAAFLRRLALAMVMERASWAPGRAVLCSAGLAGRFLRFARDGATRGGFARASWKCGGQGASPSPSLVARRELEERSSDPPRVHPRVRVAHSAKRAGTVRSVKSPGRSGAPRPIERRRDARVGQRAHRVGRAGRAVLGVLVVVEEDAVALLLPPLRRRDRRARAARPRARGRAPRGAPRRSPSAARCARSRACRASRWSSASREAELVEQPCTSSATRRTSAHSTPGRDRDRRAARRDDRDRRRAPGAGGARCSRG